MNRPDEFDYYLRRAKEAQRMAERSDDPTAQRSHREMARRYATLIERMTPPRKLN